MGVSSDEHCWRILQNVTNELLRVPHPFLGNFRWLDASEDRSRGNGDLMLDSLCHLPPRPPG